MPQAITIDDFPIETSIQWAKGQDYVHHIEEMESALPLLQTTEITVATPTYDHLTLLFEQNKRAPTWASFSPPHYFLQQSNRFFHKTLIANINPLRLIENCQEKMEALQELGTNLSPESCNHLFSLLETLEYLDALLSEIRAKIVRHSKG